LRQRGQRGGTFFRDGIILYKYKLYYDKVRQQPSDMNGIITVFVITLQFAWPTFVLLVAASGFGIFREIGRPFPPLPR
jgi:hypothetical protein